MQNDFDKLKQGFRTAAGEILCRLIPAPSIGAMEEGVTESLKYTFTAAALAEGWEMLQAASFHLQPLQQWETGLVAGVGIGIYVYVCSNHGVIKEPARTPTSVWREMRDQLAAIGINFPRNPPDPVP